MPKNLIWTMPPWMERYRPLFFNTGGNFIEDLMNVIPANATVFNNAPLALICVAVKSQVRLLSLLHAKGLLKD